MNTNIIIVIIIVLVIVVGGFFLLQSNTAEAPLPGSGDTEAETTLNDEGSNDTSTTESSDAVEANFTVTYSDDGYLPRTLTIPQGGTVTFVNESDRETWPATAIHPTHTVYPGSDIEKCGTAEEDMLFDSCGGIAPGDSWSFTFNETGEWKYHNHLRGGNNGTIIVE